MPTDAWTVADPVGCPVCGLEACEDHLPADVGRRVAPAARLRFVRAADLMQAPRPKAIVTGIAWVGCITVLVSESGTGKTFVLLDLAAAVSAGLPWHGRSTRTGAVVYLSYEGDALGLRLRAARDVRGHRLDHVHIVRAADPLSPRMTRDGGEACAPGEIAVGDALVSLAAELVTASEPALVLVIIDTARASMAGSEDNSEHVAAYLRAVRRLMARVPGAAVILAHHAGWQDGESARKRERGSSAWRGNGDATLYLEAGEYDESNGECPLTLRALKVRDDERPAPLHMIRRRVELNEANEQGQPVTSCVIEPDRRTRQDREADETAAADAGSRAVDLKTLRLIDSRPDVATSQDRIRLALGARRDLAYASIERLLSRGWVAIPARQRQPYTLTLKGRQALAEDASG